MGVSEKFQDKYSRRIAVTGGAGFIGSNLLLHLVPKYPGYLFVNIDCLTYAANLVNLKSIESSDNYRFKNISITNYQNLASCFDKYNINAIINLAAETHVDRSISGPAEFIMTNIVGTFNLLELARRRIEDFRFYHVSTDEVYGSLDEGVFTETSRYNPSSPYAASKAAADQLVNAYHITYGLNTVISNSSNNFGAYQFPEKLIPLVIQNALAGDKIPIYGDGLNVRDWLYVTDHCRAIDLIFHKGVTGLTYNVSAGNEITNIDLVKKICKIIDELAGGGPREELIQFVQDRPGHDKRYALDSARLREELGWKPEYDFEKAIRLTVEWYIKNRNWLEDCKSGKYKEYYARNYSHRLP